MNNRNYIISIDKEAISTLPLMPYPPQITVVDTAATARTALRAMAREKVVGFDTETRPAFKKGQKHKVALMQISTVDRCYLFRLNKIGMSEELKAFLENPDVLKIGLCRPAGYGQEFRNHRYITSENLRNNLWRAHIQKPATH